MTTGVSYMMSVMLCTSKYMWLMFYFQVFKLPGAFAKLRKATPKLRHVRPHGSRLPLDRFPWHPIFEYFSKIYIEKSNFITI
jgi:hypothetical protein